MYVLRLRRTFHKREGSTKFIYCSRLMQTITSSNWSIIHITLLFSIEYLPKSSFRSGNRRSKLSCPLSIVFCTIF